MAKRVTKGFAAKTEKALLDKHRKCPVCNGDIDYLRHISTGTNEKKQSMNFIDKIIRVCDCNKKEVYK